MGTILNSLTDPQVTAAIREAIGRSAHEAGYRRVDDYLKDCNLPGPLRVVLQHPRRLARCITALRIDPAELIGLERYLGATHHISVTEFLEKAQLLITTSPPPWNTWKPRSTLHVIMGIRSAHISEVGDIPQPIVGARDVLALQALNLMFYDLLKLSGTIRTHLLPHDTERQVADQLLTKLTADPHAGGVVCIGGPNVNPATDALAERICACGPDDLLARFRWSRAWDWRDAKPFLTEPAPCDANQEGVRLTREGAVLVRDRDDAIVTIRNEHGYGGPFIDPGMLLVDARTRPLKACACGHGGWGTIAAVWALEHLADRLANARLGPNRCFEVVVVDREKLSMSSRDDLDASQDGWEFYWPASESEVAQQKEALHKIRAEKIWVPPSLGAQQSQPSD